MLYRVLQKLPLSQNGKVAVGTALCLGLCAIPMSKSAWLARLLCWGWLTR